MAAGIEAAGHVTSTVKKQVMDAAQLAVSFYSVGNPAYGKMLPTRVRCSETYVLGHCRPCHIDSVNHYSNLGNCVRRPFTGSSPRLRIGL